MFSNLNPESWNSDYGHEKYRDLPNPV